MSAVSEYAELLKLIEVSGPFLSLPVFKEVFPQGLVKDSPPLTREMRELYDEWCALRQASRSIVAPAQREWFRAVLTTLLEWPAERIAEANAIPQNLVHSVAQHRETLRPDLVLMEDGKPRLLILLLPLAQEPDRRPPGSTWNATCQSRMAELLHATATPLGLVSNGERFTLVYAEPGQPTGFADFRAELWFEERLTLRAFRDFLSAPALFNRPPEQTLDALYRRSLENQQEVSVTLGRQVRRAVELFVAALDRANRENSGRLLSGVAEEPVYEAALSLMMRLVFLFFAEERDLLPVSSPVYRENYAVSTLHDQLREAADRLGEEVLERRYDAFPRLLATFRAVHGGIPHDLAALPAYGGDLFDPDRFPFLEGRRAGSPWSSTPAEPFPIHNRTVLHLLEALEFLEMKVPGGGRERRRLSFRALDIEQIGHVYEGLLDHTARRASDTVLGLEGKEEPEIALSELDRRRAQPGFVDWLAEQTGRSARAIENALAADPPADPLRWPDWDRVAPYAGLVRRDDNGEPWVILTGSLYVTAGTARRQTGTQYTPRSLTESVVEHTLAPLVYHGPAEGAPPAEWRLHPADQLLDLKVCDFACGSAAFLVAAARYLSARLTEAWDEARLRHGDAAQITPYGHLASGLPEEEILPAQADERSLYALRLVVERCLYGVDRNPLAVEMAKLSLWLLTLQRNRPFTFLDHAIRCGDSLLGVSLRQLSTWSLSGEGRQSVLFDDDLSFAADKRDGLARMLYHPKDQRRLLDAALARTRHLRAAADRLIATAFEANSEAAAAAVAMGLEEQEEEARRILAGRHPFHWPLEFPEVFRHREGFDALVGNPPYIGGQWITGVLGRPYRDYLVDHIAAGRRGSADYSAYFFLRAETLLRPGGTAGLLATNSIAQGVTREVGLDQMTARDTVIYRAIPSREWPGDATLEVAHVWCRRGAWQGPVLLDNAPVAALTSKLQPPGQVVGKPLRLGANAERSFQGSIVLGMGFVLEPEAAQRLLDKDPQNRDVLFPYLNGEDVNSRWDQSPSRWVINFHDWPLERAKEYGDCLEIVERTVKPERASKAADASGVPWWQFLRSRPKLYSTIAGMERVLVAARVSAQHCLEFVPATFVYADRLVVFPLSKCEDLALLNSDLHECWVHRPGSTTHETRNTYFPAQGFETFAFPPCLESVASSADLYHAHRTSCMTTRREGLTVVYNRFHSPHEISADIADLRRLHTEMDYAVAAAYGWTDLELGHGFHETRQGTRFTICEGARREVLDRLLALNHERYAREQAEAPAAAKPRKKARKSAPAQSSLF